MPLPSARNEGKHELPKDPRGHAGAPRAQCVVSFLVSFGQREAHPKPDTQTRSKPDEHACDSPEQPLSDLESGLG